MIADRLGTLGAAIIDTDVIAHALTRPGGAAIEPIRAAFGPEFIDLSGALDRARMRSLVFSDDLARGRLEALLHPLIRRAADEAAAASLAPYLLFVVPLLVEAGDWAARVDRVLVVDCPVPVQIERVVRTRGLQRTQVEAIIARQASRAQRLAAADDVIVNDGSDPAAVLQRAERLHAHYASLASARAAA